MIKNSSEDAQNPSSQRSEIEAPPEVLVAPAKNLSDEAITLLRNAVARAKEIPEGFYMHDWVFEKSGPPCGTAGCLAFEICVVAGGDPKKLLRITDAVADKAAELIGDKSGGMCELFYTTDWPKELDAAYDKATRGSLEAALVLEQAVERWIAGDGSFE